MNVKFTNQILLLPGPASTTEIAPEGRGPRKYALRNAHALLMRERPHLRGNKYILADLVYPVKGKSGLTGCCHQTLVAVSGLSDKEILAKLCQDMISFGAANEHSECLDLLQPTLSIYHSILALTIDPGQNADRQFNDVAEQGRLALSSATMDNAQADATQVSKASSNSGP